MIVSKRIAGETACGKRLYDRVRQKLGAWRGAGITKTQYEARAASKKNKSKRGREQAGGQAGKWDRQVKK